MHGSMPLSLKTAASPEPESIVRGAAGEPASCHMLPLETAFHL